MDSKLQNGSDDHARVALLQKAIARIRSDVSRVIVGQQHVIDEILTVLFAQGHGLLVGVPGLAKTLLVRTLSRCLDLEFRRIQFTPDLMPSDIVGTEVIQNDPDTNQRVLQFISGPVFGNLILADEINRTPPKTQAALLEAMQENQVTVGGKRRELPAPFFVLATQNPIEQQGTYPLPEAQLDRFMFSIQIDYPAADEELQIVLSDPVENAIDIQPALTAKGVLELCEIVRQVPIAKHVAQFAVEVTRQTRPDVATNNQLVQDYIAWGAGPRASQHLVHAAKSRALIHGRNYVDLEDIKSVTVPILRHRIKTNFNAEADGMSHQTIIQEILNTVSSQMTSADRDEVSKVFKSASSR